MYHQDHLSKCLPPRVCMASTIILVTCVLQACMPLSGYRGPTTDAELRSGYTYIPIDPFPVKVVDDAVSSSPSAAAPPTALTSKQVFEKLPDNAVRMSVQSLDAKGNIHYGPVAFGLYGESYRIVVDYINADTTNFTVILKRKVGEPESANAPQPTQAEYDVIAVSSEKDSNVTVASGDLIYNIPVYVGIGLRITADVTVSGGKANVAGLGVLGFEAEANRLTGSLVVQTLGVNGRSVAAALPIQSELNRTTTQNAIVAVGSIKALLYDGDTTVVPRIVGMYLPFEADRDLINRVISALSKNPPDWHPPKVQEKGREQTSSAR